MNKLVDPNVDAVQVHSAQFFSDSMRSATKRCGGLCASTGMQLT
ncbi:hypothetical protein F441_00021 [Phytophthora nicotianae CJ01A1]|uniref:Uncharacterized protein n=1 Tax=Phytophthora nicotianae CJ01A1 TaxID=1317063 RepID=W2XXN6_PHYNI|nr:hypothetical protein F441_00021 [Phytophthora nicotianae CJ01A1]